MLGSAGWIRACRLLLIKAEVRLLRTDHHRSYKRLELAKVTEKRPDFITAVQRQSAALNNKVTPRLKLSPTYTYCYFKSLKSNQKSAHRQEPVYLKLFQKQQWKVNCWFESWRIYHIFSLNHTGWHAAAISSGLHLHNNKYFNDNKRKPGKSDINLFWIHLGNIYTWTN